MELRILTRLKAKDLLNLSIYKSGKIIFIFFGFFFFMSFAVAFARDYSLLRPFFILSFPFIYFLYTIFDSIKRGKRELVSETVFNEDGIFSRDSSCESYWRFYDITKVVETGKYFYVYLISTKVFVIPKYQMGSKDNILFLRGYFIRFVPSSKLRLLRNDGSFNDNRKFSFDINREIALAENDLEDSKRYGNPMVLSLCVIGIIIVFSFFSSYLRYENGYVNTSEYDDWEYEDTDGSYVKEYISTSEKLLIVADDVLKLAEDTGIVKKEAVMVKDDEISNVSYEIYDYYTEDEEIIKELDRLNYILVNRLYEITDLRLKYEGDEISSFKGELDKLRNEVNELKAKCRNAIDSAKVKAEELQESTTEAVGLNS